MAEKPDKFPDWATEEEIDEVSGQANFVEPPDFRKESGWTRREIPPRQWFNWLARKTGLWFRWVEDQISDLGTAARKDVEDDQGTVVETQNIGTAARQDDARYAHRTNNLSDLQSASSGRDNLGVPYASEAESLAGEAADRVISPLGLRQGLNADNAPPVFGVRAWGRFDGGRINDFAVLESGNIDTIVRDSAGNYTVTFSVNMPDSNYAVTVTQNQDGEGGGDQIDSAVAHSMTESGFQIETWTAPESVNDSQDVMFIVVR